MADYFFNNPKPVNWNRELIHEFKEANSQTFKAGDFVIYSSGVAIVASDTTTTLLGIAMKDATNVTSGNIVIPIYPVYPEDMWTIRVTSGTGTLALPSTCTFGTKYALYYASHLTYLDQSDTGNDAFIPVESQDSVSTTNYWAKGFFLASACYLRAGT